MSLHHGLRKCRTHNDRTCRTILPPWCCRTSDKGTTIVLASNRSVTTQDRCVRPFDSLRIVGSAIETMVVERSKQHQYACRKKRGKNRLVS